MSILEVHARAGSNHTLWWSSPVPVTGTPTLTVRLTSGNITPNFSVVHASTAITAYASDRKTLTVTSIGSTGQGLAGEVTGRGFVVSDAAGWFPARLRHIASATSFVLAESLPISIAVGTGDAWYWSTFTATLSSANVTATASTAPIPFTIEYTPYHGVDAPADVSPRVEGLLYVVRQPFATGLDDDALISLVPALAGAYPLRQTSWQPQIASAEQTLRRWIRRELQADALNEHAVNGGAFLTVHAFLTAWTAMQGATAASGARDAQRDDYFAAAQRLFADVIASWPWIDADVDGTVDTGESEVSRRVGSLAFRSLFDGTDTDFDDDALPVFSRNQKH